MKVKRAKAKKRALPDTSRKEMGTKPSSGFTAKSGRAMRKKTKSSY